MANPNFPEPTALKKMKGNPGKKKLVKHEPKPTHPIQLIAPDHLTPAAKQVWNQLIQEFASVPDLMYQLDAQKFAMYCHSLAVYWKLSSEIEEEGEVMEGTNKAGSTYTYANPKCFLLQQAFTRVQKLGMEFGDSPSARARLGRVIDQGEEDGFTSFIKAAS